jgi:hypothetical protein
MTEKKPEVRLHLELGPNQAFSMFSALFGNFRNAIKHEHRRKWQLRIAWSKQLTAAAREQIFVFEAALPMVYA